MDQGPSSPRNVVTMEKLKYFGFAMSCFAVLFKLMSWQFAQYLLVLGLGSLGVYFIWRIFDR